MSALIRLFRSLRAVLLVLLAAVPLLLAGHTAVAEPSPHAEAEVVPLDEPPAEAPPSEAEAAQRQRRIGRLIRCPQCQGLSVADSKADAAKAMYARVGELVRQGYSDEQILDFFTDRYGDWVRLEPKAEGLNLIIFAVPAGILAFGGLWLAARAREPEEAPTPVAPEVAPASADEYRRRVLAELGDTD